MNISLYHNEILLNFFPLLSFVQPSFLVIVRKIIIVSVSYGFLGS